MKRLLLCALLAVAGASPALAQETQKAPPCASAEYRQFDFWLGEWEVTAGDKTAGTNTIRVVLDSCVVTESWESSNGQFAGKSFNRYDAASGQWEQTWVDNQGGVLKLAGGLVDGKMVLTGNTAVRSDAVTDRITWTPNPDGTVRQLWEKTKDGGTTWTIAFDGLYRKKG